MRLLTSLLTGALTLISLTWTSTGETSDPTLAWREMPLEISQECMRAEATAETNCLDRDLLRTRWIGRGHRGDMFLVMNSDCSVGACRTWFVEKGAGGVATMLTLRGQFQLLPGRHIYPSVETRLDLSASQIAYSRFDWTGDRYVRVENRLVYRVDGVECGSEDQCRELAQQALRVERVDRAVKIWENVYGVSWI
jgi:hypothetical protein